MADVTSLDDLNKYKHVIHQLSLTQDSIVELCKKYLKDPTDATAHDLLLEFLFNVDFYTEDAYKKMIVNKLKEFLIN